MEVFSYGCPACFQFQPVAIKLAASLPANAKMVYLPASFNPSEDWPMFQRAYYAAQALGVADKTHDAMYDAVWKPGGELAVRAVNHLNEETYATPAFADGRIYVRTTQALYAFCVN